MNRKTGAGYRTTSARSISGHIFRKNSKINIPSRGYRYVYGYVAFRFPLKTGPHYDWHEELAMGPAYTHIDFVEVEVDRKRDMQKGNEKGVYVTSPVHVPALNLIWRF